MGILEPGVLRDSLTTIGFLGNISKAKGIIEFLRVAEELERSGYNVRSLLAGPLWEESARPVLEDGLRRLKNLEYRGPRYGPEKAIFYKEVDVFLFPSRYRHEAEPAVIHEAMASGAPVIAWDRGCIAGMEPNLLIPMAEDFVQTSVRQLKEWLDSPATFGAASRQAAATSEVAKVRGGEQFAALLGELMGCTPMVT